MSRPTAPAPTATTPATFLTGVDHNSQSDESYTYDDNGDRTNPGYQTGQNNQLQSDGTYDYTYDAEGNLISRTEIATGETTEYVWDYRSRLIGVTTKNSSGTVVESVEYIYDLLNRRIGKVIDPDGSGSEAAQIERLVYDGDNIILTFDGNGDRTHRYLHGPAIDQVIADENSSGEARWGFGDNQNYRTPYYDPGMGRFISQDKIGFAGGDANLYRYVGNSPTNFTDPDGHIPGPFKRFYGIFLGNES